MEPITQEIKMNRWLVITAWITGIACLRLGILSSQTVISPLRMNTQVLKIIDNSQFLSLEIILSGRSAPL